MADHLHTPQTDQAVEYCVQTFKVSVLNWRKLDLCLADLDPNGTLKKLHLYSSGNKAVIRNWLSENDQGGLVKLKNACPSALNRSLGSAAHAILDRETLHSCC